MLKKEHLLPISKDFQQLPPLMFTLPVQAVEENLMEEIRHNPFENQGHIRYMHFLLAENRPNDALTHLSTIECKPNIGKFRFTREWFSMATLVLSEYKMANATKLDSDLVYWIEAMSTLERQLRFVLVDSSGDRKRNLLEATNLLYEMDQNLYKLSKTNAFSDLEVIFVLDFIEYFHGQLGLFAAILIAQQDVGNQYEQSKSTLPLLLCALEADIISYDEWLLADASDLKRRFTAARHYKSRHRNVKIGTTLISFMKNPTGRGVDNIKPGRSKKNCFWRNEEHLFDDIRKIVENEKWREQLYSTLFDDEAHLISSYLVNEFPNPPLKWPEWTIYKSLCDTQILREIGGFSLLHLKPDEGSWYCQACYALNTVEILSCLCCFQPKEESY